MGEEGERRIQKVVIMRRGGGEHGERGLPLLARHALGSVLRWAKRSFPGQRADVGQEG